MAKQPEVGSHEINGRALRGFAGLLLMSVGLLPQVVDLSPTPAHESPGVRCSFARVSGRVISDKGQELSDCLLGFHGSLSNGHEYLVVERTVESEFDETFSLRSGTRRYFVTVSCEGSPDVYHSKVFDPWVHDYLQRPFLLDTVAVAMTENSAI